MTTNHRLRIATISVICLLLVAPATVPADGIAIDRPDAAAAGQPLAETTVQPVAPDELPEADAGTSPEEPVTDDGPAEESPADEGDGDDGVAAGPTSATGPTGPEPGEISDQPGSDPAEPAPAPESGVPAPPAPAPEASPEPVEDDAPPPADDGAATDGEPRDRSRDTTGDARLVTPGQGTIADRAENTLAAITVPEPSVRDRVADAAESTRVGAETVVLTRIVENVPDWVGFAMVGLSLLALLSLGVFWRERRRRHDAEVDAMVDSLTGIANRKAFDRRLDLEWRRAARYGRSLGLMVMDLDGFKAINDLKGHAAGDQVLREVAQKLDGRMRDTDLVARIGGDEFAVICPETGINELMTIRGQLADQATRDLNEPVGLSIGVAEYVPGDQDSASILARADESMYRVKRGERTEPFVSAAHT